MCVRVRVRVRLNIAIQTQGCTYICLPPRKDLFVIINEENKSKFILVILNKPLRGLGLGLI